VWNCYVLQGQLGRARSPTALWASASRATKAEPHKYPEATSQVRLLRSLIPYIWFLLSSSSYCSVQIMLIELEGITRFVRRPDRDVHRVPRKRIVAIPSWLDLLWNAGGCASSVGTT